MRHALVIAGKDLKLRLRDRSVLIVAFVAPLALAVILGLAFGGTGPGFRATFAVADLDGSEMSRTFVEQVLGSPQLSGSVTVREVSGAEQAERLAASGDVSAAFVVPPGFEGSVRGGGEATLRVLRSSSSRVGADVAEAVARGFADRLNATRLSVITAVAGGVGEDPAALAAAAAAEEPPVRLVDAGTSSQQAGGPEYFGPAMAIFFLFFTVGFTARSLLAERESGTLSRIGAAPLRGWSVLAGKTLPAFVIGLTSMFVMLTAMRVMFGASWGDPLTLAVLTVVTVFGIFGVTAVVQTLARNQQQADSYAGIVGIVLALLGGNFFPIDQLPGAVRQIALVTPNGRALRAFGDLAALGGGLSTIWTHLVIVAGFGAIGMLIGAVRMRRVVEA